MTRPAWPVTCARPFARLLVSLYPREARSVSPDVALFVDEALSDAWQHAGWGGLLRTLATLLGDVLATWWRGPALEIAARTPRTDASAVNRRPEMDTWMSDLRQAGRRLARTPAFTALALVTLTLGIGLTTAVFTVVDQSILRPFGYPDIDRMVVLNERFESQQMSVSWPNFLDWKAQNQVLSEVGIYRTATVNWTGADEPERLSGAILSASVFTSTGLAPLLGRAFTDADDRPSAPRAAIISERLWRTHFDATADVLGRVVTLNGEPHTIVGVMPAAMRFPSRLTDIWLSLGPMVATFPTARDNHPGILAVGRLKPGVSLDAAQSAMDLIAARLGDTYPTTNARTHVVVRAYRDTIVGQIRPAFQMLLGAVGLVLLISCANLASLMLSRADARQRELAVRSALGASRSRLVRMLLTEAGLLALGGGLGGVFVAYWAVRAFVASGPTGIPRLDLIGVDGRVLLVALGISVLTGLLFGTVPACRSAVVDVRPALGTSRDQTGASAGRVRRTLVVAEVAMAFVLLVGAGLFARSLRGLLDVDLGFRPTRLVTMALSLPHASYPSVDAWLAFHRTLLDRIEGQPGIETVALASNLPLSGSAESSIVREGDPTPTPDHQPAECAFVAVSPAYFRALGIRLSRGRALNAHDTAASLPVIVIDDEAAARLYPSQDPLGKRVTFEVEGDSPATYVMHWRQIVGVVHHVRQYGLTGEPPYVQVYAPLEQLPIWMRDSRPPLNLVVETTASADAVATTVRRAIRAIDPAVPVFGLAPMSATVDDATAEPRLSLLVVSAFSGLALVLAVVGVYGVLLQSVTERTREIGLRMALGARRIEVGSWVARQAGRLVLWGLGLGLVASLGLSRVVGAMLFGISATDPLTLVSVAIVLATTAAAAAAVPARRASRVDPLVALRME